MKKYDVHVILGDKFHSVVIECDETDICQGVYVFYRHKDGTKIPFAWYPLNRTIIEEYKENNIPTGSAAWRKN